MNEQEGLEEQLDDFDAGKRRAALAALAAGGGLPDAGANVNMHMHSFLSFHAEDWSPSHNAWAARQAGLHAAGLCDFDVLDGVVEFLDAGLMLGLRTAAHIETRVFLRERADVEITSPGEPGVTYIMGAGFTGLPAEGTPRAATLRHYRDGARDRNVALIARINPQMPDCRIDYDADVLPLTPAGNATERHIVRAYVNQARRQFPRADRLAEYWAGILARDMEEVVDLLSRMPRFEEVVRSRLAKRGGLGYEQPSEHTFPPAEEFIAWVLACEAIPMITWLDGTSAGERDPRAALGSLTEKGCAALNIIPDRNWNFASPAERAIKVAHLNAIVAEARAMDLPINIGTEMNKLGLPFVDDLDGEALAPHKAVFIEGANIMAGHTRLHRYGGYSYVGGQARADFPETVARNAFFASVGALPPMTVEQAAELESIGPVKALDWFRAAVR